MIPMIGFYLTFLICILLVAWGGVEETMRLFSYLDLQLRYAWVRFRMYLMRKKLEQVLIKDLAEFNNYTKEKKDGE